MTKKQKIKQVYSELLTEDKFKLLENQINDNGLVQIMDDNHNFITKKTTLMDLGFKREDERITTWMDSKGGYFIAKSLEGIENNNGWKKIETESDLPKEYEFYDACYFDEKHKEDIPMFHGCNLPDLRNYFDEGLITHYQPIIKRDYPLY